MDKIKIIITAIIFLLPIISFSQPSDDILKEFVRQTYQKKLIRNHVTAILFTTDSKLKKLLDQSDIKDDEVFEAIVNFVDNSIINEEKRLAAISLNALNDNQEFQKLASEILLDKFTLNEMQDMLANGIPGEYVWMDIGRYTEIKAIAKVTTEKSLREIERESDKLITSILADIPKDRETKLEDLKIEKDEITLAGEAWGEWTIAMFSADLEESDGNMSQCWAPDKKLREHLSEIKFRDIIFKCFRIEQNGTTSYGFFPLPIVNNCLANPSSENCVDVFGKSILTQLGEQMH